MQADLPRSETGAIRQGDWEQAPRIGKPYSLPPRVVCPRGSAERSDTWQVPPAVFYAHLYPSSMSSISCEAAPELNTSKLMMT